ncbi:MAG TPA: SdrD B-like domain-containing protein, partial [Tepidisphaeraceae bacterium]|nr:SdrD B-like domain-containing protein [Tepidisphaeraceae bacterium]
REAAKSGWRLVSPSNQFYNLDIKSGGSAPGRLFADTQKALISGTVFNDANGNKIKDGSEINLSGWRVYLDLNKDAKFDSGDASVVSDSGGNWQFGDLSPGTYVVRVVLQSGWSLTTPSTGSFSFSVGFGSSRIGNRIGVKRT